MSERVYSVTISGSAGPYLAEVQKAAAGTQQFARTAEAAGQAGTRASDDMRVSFSRAGLAAQLMGGNFIQAAKAGAGFFTAQFALQGARRIVEGIGQVINAGADMNETLSKTGFVFGPSAAIVIATADQMAAKFGTNKQIFLEAASTLGEIGKASGLAAPAAAELGANFAKTAADVSSFFNVPFADALGAIQSGLVGQERPLRQFGVLLNEDAVNAEAMRLGLARTTSEVSEGAKVQARASLITKGFADAHGDLERTQDSLANRLRAIQGHLANFAATVGIAAGPAVLGLLDALYRLGQDGLGAIQAVGSALAPFGRSVVDIFHNLGPIITSVVDALRPFASALAAIGGGAVVTTLNALASALASTTSFLSDHRGIVTVLAAAYITTLIPAVVAAVNEFRLLAVEVAGVALGRAADGIAAIATSFSGMVGAGRAATASVAEMAPAAGSATRAAAGLGGALGSLAGPLAFLGTTAAIAGFIAIESASAAAEQKVRSFAQTLTQRATHGQDVSSSQGLKDQIASLEGLRAAAATAAYTNQRLGLGYKQAAADAGEALPIVRDQLRLLTTNESAVANATGNTTEQIEALAKKLNVDLVYGGDAAVKKLVDYILATRAAGGATAEFTAELEKNRAAAASATQATFQGVADKTSSDFLSALNPKSGGAKGKSAEELEIGLARARLNTQASAQSLAQAERTLAEERRKAAEGTAELDALEKRQDAGFRSERAALSLAAAQKNLNDLRAGAKPEDLASGELSLEQAHLGDERATRAVTDAQKALNEERTKDRSREIARDELAVAQAQLGSQRAAQTTAQAQKRLNDERNKDTLRPIIDAESHLTSAYITQERAAIAVARAQERINQIRAENSARKILDAELALEGAYIGQERAALRLSDAQEQLFLAQDHGTPRELLEAELNLREAQLATRQSALGTEDAQNGLNDARSKNTALDLADAELSLKEALLGQQQAALGVTDAQRALNEARAADNTLAVRDAELALQEAMLGERSSALGLADANDTLNKARQVDSAAAIADKEFALRDALLGQAQAAAATATAQKRLNDLRAGAKPEDLTAAELTLSEAETEVQRAARGIADTQRDLDAIRSGSGPQANAVETAELALAQAQLATKEAALVEKKAAEDVGGAHEGEQKKIELLDLTYAQHLQRIQEQIDHMLGFKANLDEISTKGFGDFSAKLATMGTEGVAVAASLHGKSVEQIQAMFNEIVERTNLGSQGFASALNDGYTQGATLSAEQTKSILTDLHSFLQDLGISLGDFMTKVKADTAAYGPGGGNAAQQWPGIIGYGETYKAPGRASGGTIGPGFVTNGAQAVVGEGNPSWPEVVIATDPKYGERNKDLWMHAGQRLGMLAAGGFVAPPTTDFSQRIWWGGKAGQASEEAATVFAQQFADATQKAAAAKATAAGPVPWANSGGALGAGDGSVPADQVELAKTFGQANNVVPRVLLAIAKQETDFGRLGAGRSGYTLGFGATDSGNIAKYAGVANQYREGAVWLAHHGVHDIEDITAGKAASWATDPGWERGVSSQYSWLQSKGYAQGGILPAGVYDRGGELPRGWSLAGNFTGRPERVGGGAPVININSPLFKIDQRVAGGTDPVVFKKVTEDAIGPAVAKAMDRLASDLQMQAGMS